MTTSIINLSKSGLLKISGPDAKKLLQGQLTCDLEEVTATESRMGAICNPQGRVISLFCVFLLNENYYLIMPQNMVASTQATLKKFAVFYKVILEDASQTLFTMGYINHQLPSHDIDESIIKIPVKNDRYVLIGDINKMNNLWNKLINHASISTPEHWKFLDLCAGIPTIYPETNAKFLPHEINLHELNAISFSKGCYTGQEIIARMHYRGKLKNHMYQAILKSDTPPPPGADVFCLESGNIKLVGSVIDSSLEENSDHLTYRTLIIINDADAKNNHLFLERDQKSFFKLI